MFVLYAQGDPVMLPLKFSKRNNIHVAYGTNTAHILWFILSTHIHTLTYGQSIPLSKYSVILQQSLETDIFSEIITILRNDYTS